MKSYFIGGGALFQVYDAETVAFLQRQAGAQAAPVTKEQVLAGAACDADYLFSTWGMPSFTEEEIAANLPRLRAVFYGAGSVQGFARPFLNRGVTVCSAWAANGVPVAEMTVAEILLANKGFYHACRRMHSKQGFTDGRRAFGALPGNYGVEVGIIGAGMIGKMVIRRLQEYDLKVLVSDPFLSAEDAAALGAEKVELEELFTRCQTISNHVANLPATVGMLHGGLFDRMKPTAAFINTGRGAQVVEADLIRALQAEPERVAVLDVTWPEPPEDGSPLYTLPNVFLTPHIAGSSGQEVARMGCYMRDQFEKFAAGQPCEYAVTLKMLETMA